MLNICTIQLMCGLEILHLCGLSEIYFYVYQDYILQYIV